MDSMRKKTHESSFLELTDENGRLVLVPEATVKFFLDQGIRRLKIELVFPRDAASTGRPWLTIGKAIEIHRMDMGGIPFTSAQARVRRACASGRIRAVGSGRDRRVDPDSFDAWRLARRDADLDAEDEDRN